MNPRIVMHTPEPTSGAARYVADLVQALALDGQPVVLFAPANFSYSAEVLKAGGSVAESGSRGTTHAGLVTRLCRNLRFFLTAGIRQILITKPADIVHFHFPLYFPAGLLYFLLAKVQASGIVFTAHDPIPHKWLLPKFLRILERACLAAAYHLSNRIIVHSANARDLLVGAFGQKPSKITIIPHGASAAAMAAFDSGASDTPFPETLRLVSFGSIRENKGIDLAITAVQRINSDGLRVRLHIAGVVANAREQNYWNDCKRLIANAPEGISVTERFIPDDEVPLLLAERHAVLLPYRDFESESGVALLALSGARALLATDSGSLAAILSAADLGIPIASATVAAVEKAIRRALEIGSVGLLQKGRNGLAFARSSRTWETIARQTASVYADVRPLPARVVSERLHG